MGKLLEKVSGFLETLKEKDKELKEKKDIRDAENYERKLKSLDRKVELAKRKKVLTDLYIEKQKEIAKLDQEKSKAMKNFNIPSLSDGLFNDPFKEKKEEEKPKVKKRKRRRKNGKNIRRSRRN